MKNGKWTKIIGSIMIVVGIIGIIVGIQITFLPQLFQYQFGSVQSDEFMNPDTYNHEMEKMEMLLTQYQFHFVLFGIVSILLSILYSYAGLTMVQEKKNYIKLAYWAIGLSMALSLIKMNIILYTDSQILNFVIAGSIVSVTVDTILGIFIILNDKKTSADDPVMPA